MPTARNRHKDARLMRTSIATVSRRGSLAAELNAIAAAGFDAVEIFHRAVRCAVPGPGLGRRG